jgi:hypothetical protein
MARLTDFHRQHRPLLSAVVGGKEKDKDKDEARVRV